MGKPVNFLTAQAAALWSMTTLSGLSDPLSMHESCKLADYPKIACLPHFMFPGTCK